MSKIIVFVITFIFFILSGYVGYIIHQIEVHNCMINTLTKAAQLVDEKDVAFFDGIMFVNKALKDIL